MAVSYTSAKLASLRPANTTEVELYVVPASTEIDAVFYICNQDTSDRTFRVAFCTAGHGDVAADGDDFVFYDKPILANDTQTLSISGEATTTIRVRASIADKLSFVLMGKKKVTS